MKEQEEQPKKTKKPKGTLKDVPDSELPEMFR